MRTALSSTRALGAIALLALLDACGDPIGKAWLVERTRVLAARVSVTTDSARATPTAGERAAVEWLLAAPGPLPKIGWSFAACVAPEGNYAAPRCDGEVIVASSGIDDGGAGAVPIRFELVTPD